MIRALTRLGLLGCFAALTALSAVPAQAAQSTNGLADSIDVTIAPTSSSVVLGQNLDLTVTVTNTGDIATPALVVHLDITNPSLSTSVDPEDWTPTLSKRIGTLEPGSTVVVDWNIQPISAGTFSTYAIALSPNVDSVASSNVLAVVVDDQRSVNPGGILPVAIGAPSLVGVLLVVQRWFARRTRRDSPAPSGA